LIITGEDVVNKKDKEILTEQFADRVSFHKTERMLYSHDAASLPDIVKQLIKTVPDAVIQPLTTNDVVFIINFARERKIPITPRGAASSGWGGAIPSRGGVVVDFTRMRKILEISPAKLSARVEAGVIWKNLETELNKRGLACRILPSSAPSATVGGWIAEGGGGIGSFEYGQISKNIISVKIVDAEGTIKVFTGDDLETVSEAEGITGLITEIEVKARKYETDIPLAASFVEMKHLLKALNEINKASLDLWHVSFSNASFNTKQDQSEIEAERVKPRWGDEEKIPEEKTVSVNKCTALFVYPESKKDRIEPLIQGIIRQNKGSLENQIRTNKLWEDRYYPIRLKRLGPSLISSESIIRTKIDHLENVIEEIEANYPDISLTITMLSRQEASVLGNILGDERSPVFTFQFPESLKIIDTACKYDGCPYSLGLYFTKFANKNLGLAKVKQIADFKKKTDPKGILNPGKILPENQNPVVINLTLALARFGSPLLSFGRKVLSRKPRLAKSIPPQLAYEAWACAQCGYCIDVCDQYYGRQWESETTRGRWYFLRQYLKGKANFDQMMLDSFLLCTTCQRCNQVCQVKIPIQQMWDKMRGQVIFEKGYHTFPGFEMMASATILESNIWLGARSERDKWVPPDVKPLEK
jgi:FAD/FMN-containing dehydrogenase/ferredoxin